jgi:hypothetical protein
MTWQRLAHTGRLSSARLNPMHGRQDHDLPDPRVGRRGQEVIEESCAAGNGIDHGPQAEFAVVADIVGCPANTTGSNAAGYQIKPIHVRYHRTNQGISDTQALPIIHQVPDAPMMRLQVLSTNRRCHCDG